MLTTVNTFVGCFTAICVAIAVANVFNTLSNSLMLRRREFAVLRSIGMGTGAFRRMIAYECASLALRGFIIGTALSVLAAWGLWQSMSLSFRGYGFALPLGHLALAGGIILAVIAVSTVYALKKSRIDSVVEALRDDAI